MHIVVEPPAITERVWADLIEPRLLKAECWTWTDTLLPHGYALIRIPGSRNKQYVHRLAYELFNGPIPDGFDVDHLCRNRSCCNPAHLEAVTHRENVLRGEAPAAHRARQTHCIHGHPFDAENTYIAPNGTRKCKTCRARVRHESYHRRKLAA